MPEIFSDYNIEKDAYNRRAAMNSSTNGRLYETMSEKDRNILSHIKGLSQGDANKILIPFLERKYKDNREEIDDAVSQIKIKLDTQKDQILRLMEELTKRPILMRNFRFGILHVKDDHIIEGLEKFGHLTRQRKAGD